MISAPWKLRLHQMMFAGRVYERKPVLHCRADSPVVNVQNWAERGYSVVNEFDMRHTDGTRISSEPERHRVIRCLQAATERRASQCIRLELCTSDRQGLLTDVTRTFRENGLNVTRAEISTAMGVAANVFHITYATGNLTDPKIIELVRHRIGSGNLNVKELPFRHHQMAKRQEEQELGVGGAVLLSLGRMKSYMGSERPLSFPKLCYTKILVFRV
ncbi:hypothetical protein V6N11_030577 [Hibiscus sabdariffa]|uniref:ACT domain-containing protein ACR n=2 Tax=Hibiscus sabdariffa TaxID=183260 RepID=A0ABR2BA81_9ROSI